MKIRNCYTRFVLPCFVAGLLIFSIPALGFSAKPGLLCSDGVQTQTIDVDDPFTVLAHGIKVVDYDGIADDGGSHVVTVIYPNGSIKELSFSYTIDEHSAHYSLWDDTIDFWDESQTPPEPYPETITDYTGDYVYTVIDVPGDDDAVAIDYLDVQLVNPPNETTFSPGYGSPQRIIAYFDNVKVNGVLKDDFESGFLSEVWEEQPEVVTFVENNENWEACFNDEWGATESGDRSMDLLDPETVNKLEVDVRIDPISGDHPVARIGGIYFNDGEGDIKAVVFISCDEARYVIYRNIENSDIREWVVPPTLLSDELTEGNTYTLSINWDGTAFTFGVSGADIVDITKTFLHSGEIHYTENDRHIDVYCWVTVDSTTPIFYWETDPPATCYAVCIYNSEGQAIFCGDLKSPPYQLPPGVLKPGGEYFYMITVFKHHQWFEWDNFASSEWGHSWFHVETEEEAQEPYIGLPSYRGVRTLSYWQDEERLSIVIGVHDAQGVPGNIATVKVIFPDGHTERPLYLLRNDGPYSGTYLTEYFGSMPDGPYTFVVEDRDGNTYQTSDNFTPGVLESIDPLSLQPAHNEPISEDDDTVLFQWDAVSGAQVYGLKIFDQHDHGMFGCMIDSKDTQVILPVGLFETGKTYSYRVHVYDAFFEDELQNLTQTNWGNEKPHFKIAPVNVGVDTNLPALDLDNWGVSLAHVAKPDGSGTHYHLEFLVKVTDSDGVPNNIDYVTVTYPGPEGKTTPLYYWYGDSDTEGYYRAMEILDSVPPAGTYTFRVEDHFGNKDDLTDEITPAPLPIPQNITPESGAIVSLQPTFRWNLVLGAIKYKLRLYSGWNKELFQSDPFSEPSYQVPENILEPDDIYQYRVYAFREDPDMGDIDNFSCNTFAIGMMPHFFTTGNICEGDFDTDGDVDGAIWQFLPLTLAERIVTASVKVTLIKIMT